MFTKGRSKYVKIKNMDYGSGQILNTATDPSPLLEKYLFLF
jgi:hypothetical protein